MENKDLFKREENGYNCEQVENYVSRLKAEYKKVFDYAKATEVKNEDLKKLCKALSDENKALKANGAVAAAPANAGVMENVAKIVELCDEIAKENAALRSKM